MITHSVFQNGTYTLKDILEKNDFKPFAYKQIFSWIFKRNIYDFQDMTNISKPLREFLSENMTIFTTEKVRQEMSADGTIKFALKTQDGGIIESVIIFDKERRTLCISSQIGCPLACRFCVTGMTGFRRDLEAYEIIEQILWAERIAGRPTNIVFMGMGEPLLNLTGVKTALELIFSEQALYFGKRKVTVSTCGIPDAMLELDKKFTGLRWAISLHSADSNIRNRLMPVNKTYSLQTLVHTMKSIKLKKGMSFTIEYILLNGINTGKTNAEKMISLLKGLKYKVNLIVYNENPFCDFRKPTEKEVTEFQHFLESKGIVAKIRKSKGEDISAACGQLAFKEKKDQE